MWEKRDDIEKIAEWLLLRLHMALKYRSIKVKTCKRYYKTRSGNTKSRIFKITRISQKMGLRQTWAKLYFLPDFGHIWWWEKNSTKYQIASIYSCPKIRFCGQIVGNTTKCKRLARQFKCHLYGSQQYNKSKNWL